MQCPSCPDRTVEAFCRNCGKGVCSSCRKDSHGVPYCEECSENLAAATGYGSTIDVEPEPATEAVSQPEAVPGASADESSAPPPVPPRPRPPASTVDSDLPQPVLAGLLGLVPGLGAVYNGQYVKGFLHVIIFGLLIALVDSSHGGPPFILMLMLMVLYMPIEAYRTAKALRRGEKVDELSGLISELMRSSSESPAVGVVVIAVGVLLLLFNLGVFRFEAVLPFWPLLLIGFGAYRLYTSIVQAQSREEQTAGFESHSDAPPETPVEANER